MAYMSGVEDLATFILAEVPGEPSEPQGAIDTAIRVIRTLLKDKQRLDFVESQSSGGDWAARASTTGRGFRLHNTTGHWGGGAGKTAREAIDSYQRVLKETEDAALGLLLTYRVLVKPSEEHKA